MNSRLFFIIYNFIYSYIHQQNDINFSNIIFIRIHKDTKILWVVEHHLLSRLK